jgi:hypothetical protein
MIGHRHGGSFQKRHLWLFVGRFCLFRTLFLLTTSHVVRFRKVASVLWESPSTTDDH